VARLSRHSAVQQNAQARNLPVSSAPDWILRFARNDNDDLSDFLESFEKGR
jgi:hypothetical protein